MDYLQSGQLGEIYMAKGLCYKWRDTIFKTPDEPIPEGVDYDLWLGPAPKRPFQETDFTTSGIGTGIMETEILATRVFTNWTLRAGDWVLSVIQTG